MKLIAASIALVLSLLAVETINKKCPYTKKDVNPEKVSEYKGQSIGFCCDNCKGKFDKAPDTEIKKVPEYKAKKVSVDADASVIALEAINKKCPYTKKDVAAGKSSDYKGKEIGFCCDNCKGKFDKAPDVEIKKVAEYKASK